MAARMMAFTFVLFSSVCLADQPAEAGKPYLVSYEISDIVAKRASWTSVLAQPLEARDRKSEDASEGLYRSLLTLLIDCRPELAGKFLGKNAAFSVDVVNGNHLAVRADKKTHDEIEHNLRFMRNTLDLAVIVECRLYELDRVVYEREILKKFPRHPGKPPVFVDPATDETERKFLNGPPEKRFSFVGLNPLLVNKVTLQNRVPGKVLSWHTAVGYETRRLFEKAEKHFVFPGFDCVLSATVSRDRRMTHLKFTQKVTDLVAWQKVKALKVEGNQEELREVTFEVPVVQDTSYSNNFRALDSWPVVVPIQLRQPQQGADRQLVLEFTARILIEEEERAIKEGLLPKLQAEPEKKPGK